MTCQFEWEYIHIHSCPSRASTLYKNLILVLLTLEVSICSMAITGRLAASSPLFCRLLPATGHLALLATFALLALDAFRVYSASRTCDKLTKHLSRWFRALYALAYALPLIAVILVAVLEPSLYPSFSLNASCWSSDAPNFPLSGFLFLPGYLALIASLILLLLSATAKKQAVNDLTARRSPAKILNVVGPEDGDSWRPSIVLLMVEWSTWLLFLGAGRTLTSSAVLTALFILLNLLQALVLLVLAKRRSRVRCWVPECFRKSANDQANSPSVGSLPSQTAYFYALDPETLRARAAAPPSPIIKLSSETSRNVEQHNQCFERDEQHRYGQRSRYIPEVNPYAPPVPISVASNVRPLAPPHEYEDIRGNCTEYDYGFAPDYRLNQLNRDRLAAAAAAVAAAEEASYHQQELYQMSNRATSTGVRNSGQWSHVTR